MGLGLSQEIVATTYSANAWQNRSKLLKRTLEGFQILSDDWLSRESW